MKTLLPLPDTFPKLTKEEYLEAVSAFKEKASSKTVTNVDMMAYCILKSFGNSSIIPSCDAIKKSFNRVTNVNKLRSIPSAYFSAYASAFCLEFYDNNFAQINYRGSDIKKSFISSPKVTDSVRTLIMEACTHLRQTLGHGFLGLEYS